MKKRLEDIDAYKVKVGDTIVNIDIFLEEGEVVPTYNISILNISKTTQIILKKIRDEFVSKITLSDLELGQTRGGERIKDAFVREIKLLVKKYFPNIDEDTTRLLVNHVIREYIGLGDLEILMWDKELEEIVVNNSKEPVWVFHRKHGWLKTNIEVPSEKRIRHYITMIAREAGREITLLKPLMDAALENGDRVNATLAPISTKGNTLTIRKFRERPWSIVDFIEERSINIEGAALLWLAVENELSTLISGGTASGKTSMLNCISNFFPPNQRIISIEDTRELTLPKTLHWVPMETRLPNPEGKGEVTMLDLIINALRMRPDRIIMGEIRRQREAEVLFEAMHTGHSVYATLHANDVEETINRLTNPPINVPKMLLGAVSLVVVMNRNRRTGKRRTLQIAEITPTGDYRVLMQYDFKKDELVWVNKLERIYQILKTFNGMEKEEVDDDLKNKMYILKQLCDKGVKDVHTIGQVLAKYYFKRIHG
ncbi:Flp pilus assembly complex ATPase component TadA [Candidatus Woesearchaeota archaeon]|nr:Flp pilus assembly complex ATPase component TadA [Candidatus Woesearchaeota archaeon]